MLQYERQQTIRSTKRQHNNDNDNDNDDESMSGRRHHTIFISNVCDGFERSSECVYTLIPNVVCSEKRKQQRKERKKNCVCVCSEKWNIRKIQINVTSWWLMVSLVIYKLFFFRLRLVIERHWDALARFTYVSCERNLSIASPHHFTYIFSVYFLFFFFCHVTVFDSCISVLFFSLHSFVTAFWRHNSTNPRSIERTRSFTRTLICMHAITSHPKLTSSHIYKSRRAHMQNTDHEYSNWFCTLLIFSFIFHFFGLTLALLECWW